MFFLLFLKKLFMHSLMNKGITNYNKTPATFLIEWMTAMKLDPKHVL